MPKTGRRDDFSRTYKDVFESVISSLNSQGANIVLADLSDTEKADLLKFVIVEARRDCLFFMRHVLGLNVYWFHERWFRNWLTYRYCCNVSARGSGKTFFFSKVLPCWLAVSRPDYGAPSNDFESIIVGYNEEASKDFLGGVRDFIERNELLSNLVGIGNNVDWNKMNLELSNSSVVMSRSFSGHLRGKHVKFIAVDDVLNDDSGISPDDMRNKINAVIFPMLRRMRGKFNIVGTLFSEDDIYHYFEEKAKDPVSNRLKLFSYFKVWVELDEDSRVVYICEYDDDGNVVRHLDTGVSNIYDFDDLLFAKEQEPLVFAREYECRIVSNAEVPFPMDSLKACLDKELSYKDLSIPPVASVRYCSGLDSSNSTRKDSDSTVLMTGYHETVLNKVLVVDYYDDNVTSVPDRLRELAKRLRFFNNSFCLAEKNSMGETNIQVLNDNHHLRVAGFVTSRESKLDLTNYASQMVKAGRVVFPYKTLMDRDRTDRLLRQLSGVVEFKTRTGLRSYRGSTKHDDLYIAFILFLKAVFDNRSVKASVSSYKRDDLLKSVVKGNRNVDLLVGGKSFDLSDTKSFLKALNDDSV